MHGGMPGPYQLHNVLIGVVHAPQCISHTIMRGNTQQACLMVLASRALPRSCMLRGEQVCRAWCLALFSTLAGVAGSMLRIVIMPCMSSLSLCGCTNIVHNTSLC